MKTKTTQQPPKPSLRTLISQANGISNQSTASKSFFASSQNKRTSLNVGKAFTGTAPLVTQTQIKALNALRARS
jgi:hypothetical protein